MKVATKQHGKTELVYVDPSALVIGKRTFDIARKRYVVKK